MPSRRISTPTSLNEKLAGMPQTNGNGKAEHTIERSEAAAVTETQNFSRSAREPLASSKTTQAKPGVTFAAQDKLPKLPIPELEQTLKKYLIALEPLQSGREHRATENAVDDFLHNEGPQLQERLKQYATGKSSYIEQFWYDSYLNYDQSVVLNLNPFFLLEDDPTPARNNQVTRAASLVVSALAFVRAVRKEELPPDMLRNQPLDMYQYSRLFGTARIPTDHGCRINEDQTSKHIVVICRGQFYWFDILDHNNDIIMTENDVSQNLETIFNDATETSIFDAAKGALGVLSTENRKTWSDLRNVLHREQGSNNSDCLNIVDSALFILCLDDTEPQNAADLCMNMLCGTSEIERGVQIGTCTNRWYDKLQIIVCKNGSAGINFEHTGVDGHTVLRFASDLYTDTILRYAKSINGQAPSLWASTSPDPTKRDPKSFGDVSTVPHKLEWDMLPEVTTAIRFAETRLADLIQQNEFATIEFKGYGSNFMKAAGFSPDAFVQMAYQAAYYGLYGRMECVYEPAMTKMYYHGRTEAIRPVTTESSEFVKTFWGENPPEQKVEALKAACERHSAITKESAKAQGQDRHLYALYCLWQRGQAEGADSAIADADSNGYSSDSELGTSPPQDEPRSRSSTLTSEDETSVSLGSHLTRTTTVPERMPQIFTDSGWETLNTTIISTSNCGNPSLRQFGFGPTSAEGFGIGYIIKEGSVSICASSKHRQTKRFVDAIESYFLEMRKLLRQTMRKAPGQDKTISRAREVEEERPKVGDRMKSRGRAIGSELLGTRTPLELMGEDSDDDGLGGYGFFDAGMLLQKLKIEEEGNKKDKEHRRANVGKKLKIMEY